MVHLLLRCVDHVHKWNKLLGEKNVMVSHEGHFVFHTVYNRAHESLFFKKRACVLHNLLEVVLLLLGQLMAVELAFEKDDSQEIEQIDLFSVVLVIKSRAKGLNNWTNNQMLDLTLKVGKVFYRVEN